MSHMSDAEGPRNLRASFGRYMAESALQYKAWSPANVDLLEMVSHGLASRLYAESLPVDLQATFAQVSHELRTPFHGAMVSLEVLQATHSKMKAGEWLGIIQAALQCGGSMLSTLSNILDIAKGCNNIEVAQDRFLASSPILFTVAAMTPFATSEGLDLVTNMGEPADEIVEVIGDERRINAILQNLVTNAIKFTPRGGKVRTFLLVFDSLEQALDWWTKESDRFEGKVLMGNVTEIGDSVAGGKPPPIAREKKWHVFCVEDSGTGVLPGTLPRLVAPYRQMLHGAHPGTGLGLHICKEYVDLMHGALGIVFTLSKEGKPGGGTMFSVVLPLRPAEMKAEPAVPASSGQQEPGAVAEKLASTTTALFGDVRGRNLVFLVADDHVLNTKLLQRKITMFFKGSGGYHVEVLTASDGLLTLDERTALRGTQSSSDGAALACMFVDFQMPNLDGVECTRGVRLLEVENGWPRTTIYGCTANPSDKMRDMFLGGGGDGVVSKPWQTGQVEAACVASVQRFIEDEKSRAVGGARAAGGV